MLLADVVATARDVAATSSRTAKIEALGALLARASADEAPIVVGILVGWPRQGRIGVGWAAVAGIEQRPAAAPSLTLADLDDVLARVQATTGAGSQAARAALLGELFARATVDEADLIRRLLLGEMRQGALEGVMADAIARAAEVPAATVRRAAMLTGDLGRTAALALDGGRAALDAVGLEVLRPVSPMLASSAETVEEALAGEASVEWKLDGIRIQVHRAGDEVRVYTRNLNDITARAPEIVEIARALPADPLVLDGEAIAQGPFFFDVLHAAGEDLLDAPLRERIARLDAIAGAWSIPRAITASAAEAQHVLDDALAAGHEGIVVKDLSSVYAAGRRGKAWRKVKVAKTFDLVVLAAEWGSGRRRGWLSNLHLGACDPDGGFVMVGKTFKGLTDELLAWQTERFQQIETARRGHVVEVRPELVVEIELDGVQASTRYPGGVGLRFARVVRYRDDKRPDEADTIEALRALLNPQSS